MDLSNEVEQLRPLLQNLIRLEEDMQIAYQKQEKLHLRYTSIITETPLFELNIPLQLLDDPTVQKLDPYFHSLETLLDEDTIILGEKLDLKVSKNKYILENDVPLVCEILGIEGTIDSTYYREILTKLINIHEDIIDLISEYIMKNGEKGEYYFGKKFYPKLQGTKFAFSIDEKASNIYLMNYGIDDDIPLIHRIATHSNILIEAIHFISISQDELDMYTVY